MKKEYTAPQAKKIEFNYTDTVVASNTQEPSSDTDTQPASVPATMVPIGGGGMKYVYLFAGNDLCDPKHWDN